MHHVSFLFAVRENNCIPARSHRFSAVRTIIDMRLAGSIMSKRSRNNILEAKMNAIALTYTCPHVIIVLSSILFEHKE